MTCRAERNCFAFLLSHAVAVWLGHLGTSLLFITLIYFVEPSHSLLLIAPFFSRDFIALDCRIVGFFLKIGKEIGKVWLKSLTRAKLASLTRPYGMWGERKKNRVSPQSRSLFSASFKTFCLTACEYLNTQKYGLFCRLSLLRNHKTLVMQAALAGPQTADVEKKTRRKPEGVRPNCFRKRLQGPVYFSFLKWRVEGHLLNKNGSYWRVNRSMLTQPYLPGNVLRIRFYAHLQRARLRCIAWTSPKKNKYYATVKFFMKHYSNATSLKPRYFRQRRLTSLWLVLVLALQVVFCSKVSSSAVASLPRNKHFHTHIIWWTQNH